MPKTALTHPPGRFIVAAAAGALAVATSASAGVVPDVGFDLVVSDGTNLSQSLSGASIGTDLFNYAGSLDDVEGDWSLTYDFLSSQNPYDADGAFLTNGFTVTNNTDGMLSFMLTLTLAIDPVAAPETSYLGSVGVTLNGFDGLLTTNSSIFTAMINDTAYGTLFDDPFSLSFDGAGTADASENLTGGIDGPASEISIILDFNLSPGDSFTSTGAFGILAIPAPGALALLGVAGLAGGRRRRA